MNSNYDSWVELPFPQLLAQDQAVFLRQQAKMLNTVQIPADGVFAECGVEELSN